MDPVTQGALGAAVTAAILQRRLGRRAWRLGLLGGIAADIDVLIRSPSDPLIGLEFHRHFTHSLAFIPIGGLVCALPWLLRRSEHDKRGVLAATTLGYATHALLDAFTSYGTMLWWPFSNTRVAWNVISIIDPLFTLPLIAGLILAARAGKPGAARIGLAIAAAYMGLCGVQRGRALAAQDAVLRLRGHEPVWRDVFPLFGHNSRWRSVYAHEHMLWADAFHTRWFGKETRWVTGGSVEQLLDHEIPDDVKADAETKAAYELFGWFATGRLVGYQHEGAFRICDTRYSMDPEAFTPVFCLDLRPGAAEPVLRPSLRSKSMGRLVEKYFPGVGEVPTRRVPWPRDTARLDAP